MVLLLLLVVLLLLVLLLLLLLLLRLVVVLLLLLLLLSPYLLLLEGEEELLGFDVVGVGLWNTLLLHLTESLDGISTGPRYNDWVFNRMGVVKTDWVSSLRNH